MKNNTIIYSLTVEDVQSVAIQELGRKLSFKEIENIKDTLAEQISWYDSISYSIHEKLGSEKIN